MLDRADAADHLSDHLKAGRGPVDHLLVHLPADRTASRPHRRRLAGLTGALALAALAGAALPAAPAASAQPTTTATASPGTAADARAQAARARDAAAEAARRVVDVRDALAHQQDAVAAAVSASIGAEVAARQGESARDDAAAERTRRIRSLYMDAGTAVTRTTGYALLRSVADGADPALVLRGRDLVADRAVAVVADHDEQLLTAAQEGAERSRAAARDADGGAVGAVAGLREVAARASALQDALQRAELQVSALDERAARLQDAEDAAAALAAARAAAAALAVRATGTAAGVHARAVPADYAGLYARAAATCPGMRPSLLSAVGQVESGHGRDVGPSSAGALGPMQFMPATFAVYAVDGDGDGTSDVLDPADAVFTAARYLCANGAGRSRAGEAGALYRYNHADWYVAMVQRIADEADGGGEADGS